MVTENSFILLESDTKAIEKVLSVGSGELGAVCEASAVSCGVGMVLYSFNDVSKTLSFESFLGEDNVDISAWLGNVGEVSLVDISGVDWMSHESLVIWNWPGWSAHNSERVVSIWVDRADEGVLARERSLGSYKMKDMV